MKRILAVILVLMMIFPMAFGISLPASAKTITVRNESALAEKLAEAADGDIIKLSGTVTLTSSFVWPKADKKITVTGGALNASSLSELNIGCSVVFDATSLSFMNDGAVYANGNHFEIKENVSVSGSPYIYGGANNTTLNGDTSLDIRSGTYKKIFGGNNGGTLNGSTNVFVGGYVNSSVTWTNHGGSNNFYGGGNGDTIAGSTNLVVAGNAKANYIYGGSEGGNGIGGGTNFLMSGGYAMSLYGGSNGSDPKSDVSLTMSGGEVEQIFGGCYGASLTGNVSIKVLGGRVTRRIYGGCYNETNSGIAAIINLFSTSYKVSQSILMTIGPNAVIDFSASYNDKSIFIGSRIDSKNENRKLILVGDAYSTYKDKTGVQDQGNSTEVSGYKTKMSGVQNDDKNRVCGMQYTEQNDTLTETCTSCTGNKAHSATASVSLKSGADNCVYNGSAYDVATVSYSSGWISGKIDSISYDDNVNAGTVRASASINGATAAVSFEIKKAYRDGAPEIELESDETVRGKKDGKIEGISTEMEYRLEGETEYTKVSRRTMTFGAGTYYFRYADSQNYYASVDSEAITVGEGRDLSVKFFVDGELVDQKLIAYGESITDIPEIPDKEGFSKAWDLDSFENLTEDKEVNAVYTEIPTDPTPDNSGDGDGSDGASTPAEKDNDKTSGGKKPSTSKQTEAAVESDSQSKDGQSADLADSTDNGSGCSSSIGAGVIVAVAMISLAMTKKKKED